MEAGFRTPLLDFFRRGEVARDVRLLAAQGALAPRAHEQLGLLMLLVNDQDPSIAAAAEATLAAIPRGSLEAFLARSDASAEMRSFFAARGIEPGAVAATDLDAPLLDTEPGGESGPDEEEAPPEGKERLATIQKIAAMTVAQRVQLAMKGTREERAILVRDNNKLVGVSVLSSPKMTETEIESIAKMASISDELLRIIANTRAWVKNYQVAVALSKNPKTPVAVSMNLLQRLNERDLRMLSIDRNIPELLRLTARKKLIIEKR
jgi:hypothetical protein